MTDKSRMMSVDAPKNNVEAMEKHTRNDRKVTKEKRWQR